MFGFRVEGSRAVWGGFGMGALAISWNPEPETLNLKPETRNPKTARGEVQARPHRGVASQRHRYREASLRDQGQA